MPQKSISLPEKIYLKLKQKKGPTEKFPDLIERLLNEEDSREQRHHIDDLEGAFGDDSDEWEQIKEELYKDRMKKDSRPVISLDS
jgi:predicted CopG family antitoxin